MSVRQKINELPDCVASNEVKKVHKEFSKCNWKQLKILFGSSDELEEADMYDGWLRIDWKITQARENNDNMSDRWQLLTSIRKYFSFRISSTHLMEAS